jgi:PTS system mannose-specific IIA component
MAGLLLITHGTLGADMLDTVRGILCGCPLPAETLAIDSDADTDALYQAASDLCTRLDDGDGVLVLTDLYGSTPSNIANRLVESHNVNVISGANVPMLLRILNYPQMNLEALAEKAASGARDGIVVSSRKQAS